MLCQGRPESAWPFVASGLGRIGFVDGASVVILFHDADSCNFWCPFFHAPVKGRLLSMGQTLLEARVSIHAPVKGRPGKSEHGCEVETVSIHAPVKGRPCLAQRILRFRDSFNPRPREGATRLPCRPKVFLAGFNPRPREGATAYMIKQDFHNENPGPSANHGRIPGLCSRGFEVPQENTMMSGRWVECEHPVQCMTTTGSRFQNIRGPSKSTAGFVPTCSTRRRQFDPSK